MSEQETTTSDVTSAVFVTAEREVLSELSFELSSLTHAVRYQQWISRTVEPFLGKRILEIGAGLGNMSQWLPVRERLVLTEMDSTLLGILKDKLAGRLSQPGVSVHQLDLAKDDLRTFEEYDLDTIISFNVLEHIEDDHDAMGKLAGLLRKSRAPGPKRLISFVPAHSWAYGSMDRTYGHFRRYSRERFARLRKQIAPEARIKTRYFNSFGLLGWVLTGRILKRTNIGSGSIQAFESLCPVLSVVDDFIHYNLKFPFGQSLLSVMEWD